MCKKIFLLLFLFQHHINQASNVSHFISKNISFHVIPRGISIVSLSLTMPWLLYTFSKRKAYLEGLQEIITSYEKIEMHRQQIELEGRVQSEAELEENLYFKNHRDEIEQDTETFYEAEQYYTKKAIDQHAENFIHPMPWNSEEERKKELEYLFEIARIDDICDELRCAIRRCDREIIVASTFF